MTMLDLISSRLNEKLGRLPLGLASEDIIEIKVLDALRTEMVGLISEEVD